MNVNEFTDKAKKVVADYENISVDEVFIVWFCKTLQNWKAILATTQLDAKIYEATYNGNKEETYVDIYKKESNIRVKDE